MNLVPSERRALSKSIASVLRSTMASTNCIEEGAGNPHGSCGLAGACADPSHVFFSYHIPGMSIDDYIFRLMTYMSCDDYVFRTAVVYVKRLVDASSSCSFSNPLTPWSVHRIFLGASIIASKICDDEPRHMQIFSSCGGVECSEACAIELVLLSMLGYDLFVSADQFRQVNKVIEAGFFAKSLATCCVTPSRSSHHRQHSSTTPLSCSTSFGALSEEEEENEEEDDNDNDNAIQVICT